MKRASIGRPAAGVVMILRMTDLIRDEIFVQREPVGRHDVCQYVVPLLPESAGRRFRRTQSTFRL